MKIIVCDKRQAWADVSADLFRVMLADTPKPVVILPTGSTPEMMYARLVQDYRAGKISFRNVTTYNLDEYVGLQPDHDQSYRYFMQTHLFDHVDIPQENTHVPLGTAPDMEAECEAYERSLAAAGGADICLISIGTNGHIGFNEPGTPFNSRTHLQALSENTRRDNSRFFASPEEVPHQAITMGLSTIMSARKILFIACGMEKAIITHRALTGPISEDVPASVLQRHPDVTVVLDSAAGQYLR